MEILLRVIALGLLAALAWYVTALVVQQLGEALNRPGERSGFEVKPTTGTTPVLREKDNDHG